MKNTDEQYPVYWLIEDLDRTLWYYRSQDLGYNWTSSSYDALRFKSEEEEANKYINKHFPTKPKSIIATEHMDIESAASIPILVSFQKKEDTYFRPRIYVMNINVSPEFISEPFIADADKVEIIANEVKKAFIKELTNEKRS